MFKPSGVSFMRRMPDNVTEELVAVLSSRASFEFKPLFDIVLLNLRERNAASGGEEMLRLRVYETLQGLVGPRAGRPFPRRRWQRPLTRIWIDRVSPTLASCFLFPSYFAKPSRHEKAHRCHRACRIPPAAPILLSRRGRAPIGGTRPRSGENRV